MTEYRPIDCALHDEYELAIMQRRRLQLEWRDADDRLHSDTVMPADLLTRAGEEYLLAHDSQGNALQVRLDRIIRHR